MNWKDFPALTFILLNFSHFQRLTWNRINRTGYFMVFDISIQVICDRLGHGSSATTGRLPMRYVVWCICLTNHFLKKCMNFHTHQIHSYYFFFTFNHAIFISKIAEFKVYLKQCWRDLRWLWFILFGNITPFYRYRLCVVISSPK